jgi:hypothetical protein
MCSTLRESDEFSLQNMQRIAGINITREHGVDDFAQERVAEGGIVGDPLLHQFFETARQCHGPGFFPPCCRASLMAFGWREIACR